MSTVFYSWQSDLPGNTNRNFIEVALNKALRALQKDPDVYQPPREVDRDTAGVAGSPHIAETIFDKIDAASACVFDVSIVLRGEGRVSPNPNVLVELGYALKAHPAARVIMVLNAQTGTPEELPFDLRFRRVLLYNPVEVAGTRAAAKAELVKDLVAAFKATFAHNEENRFSTEEKTFHTKVYARARSVLDSENEYPDRARAPEIDQLRRNWAVEAQVLRDLAGSDLAAECAGLPQQMESLATGLDALATWQSGLGNGHVFKAKLREVATIAESVLAASTPYIEAEFKKKDYGSRKRECARKALAALGRLKSGLEQLDSNAINSARFSLAENAGSFANLAAELELAGDPDAQMFRPAAHGLGVANIVKSRATGFEERRALLVRLAPLLEPLDKFTQ